MMKHTKEYAVLRNLITKRENFIKPAVNWMDKPIWGIDQSEI